MMSQNQIREEKRRRKKKIDIRSACKRVDQGENKSPFREHDELEDDPDVPKKPKILRKGEWEGELKVNPPNFLLQWNQTSYQLEIDQEVLRRMRDIQRKYWTIKLKNMKAIVLWQHVWSCYFFFHDIQEFEEFQKLVQSHGQDMELEISLLKVLEREFRGLIPVRVKLVNLDSLVRMLFVHGIPYLVVQKEKDPFHQMKPLQNEMYLHDVRTPAICLGKHIFGGNLLMAFTVVEEYYSALFLDASTNEFFAEQGKVDYQGNFIRALKSKYKPRQIIIYDESESETAFFEFSQNYMGFVAVLGISAKEHENLEDFLQDISQQTGANYLRYLYYEFKQWKKGLRSGRQANLLSILITIKIMHKYLSGLGLASKIFKQGIFLSNYTKWDDSFFHLEPSLNPFAGENEGNKQKLQDLIKKCQTNQGQRIASYYLEHLLSRKEGRLQIQQAAQQMLFSDINQFSKRLYTLRDLSKNIGVLYHLNSPESDLGRNIKVELVIFNKSKISKSKTEVKERFQELIKVKDLLIESQQLLSHYSIQKGKSQLLRNFKIIESIDVPSNKEIEGIPSVTPLINHLFKGVKNGMPIQLQNCQEQRRIKQIRQQLKEHETYWKAFFKYQQLRLNRSSNYLQIPRDKLPQELSDQLIEVKTNEKRKIKVFKTKQIQDLVEEQDQKNQLLEKKLKNIFYQHLQQFCSLKSKWNKITQAVAWMDVIISSAKIVKFQKENKQFHSQQRAIQELPLENRQEAQNNKQGGFNLQEVNAEEERLPRQDECQLEKEPQILKEVENFLEKYQPYNHQDLKHQIKENTDKQIKLRKELEESQHIFTNEKRQIHLMMEKARKLQQQNNELQCEVQYSINFEKYDNKDKQEIPWPSKKNNNLDSALWQDSPTADKILSEFQKVGGWIINTIKDEDATAVFQQIRQKLKKIADLLDDFNIQQRPKLDKQRQRVLKYLLKHLSNQHQRLIMQQYCLDVKNCCHYLQEKINSEKKCLFNLRQDTSEKQIKYKELQWLVQKKKGNVRVLCRVRPHIKNKDFGRIIQVPSINKVLLTSIRQGTTNKITMTTPYQFDRVFKQNASQESIFQEIAFPIQSSIDDGVNICVFCYGQTGSGKTYTMIGQSEEKKGILPRTVDLLFKSLEKRIKKGEECHVSLDIIEVYKRYKNLLHSQNQGQDIKSKEEMIKFIEGALKQRKTSKTSKNSSSSRSHLILYFRYWVAKGKEGGSIALVDLAGSEEVKGTPEQVQEGKAINNSLLALSSYLRQIKEKNPHKKDNIHQTPSKSTSKQQSRNTLQPSIPNILVKVLKPILEANCIAIMCLNVSPDEQDLQSTRPCLVFGRNIMNQR